MSGPYELQITQTSNYNVVIYDSSAQRGWLLDGTSFLLHLSRAALSHSKGIFQKSHSSNRLEDKFMHLDSHGRATGRGTPRDVLLHNHNRQLHILPGMGECCECTEGDEDSGSRSDIDCSAWCFEDLVLHFAGTLDQIVEHQVKLRNSQQWEVKYPFSSPKTLEGFSFLDVLEMKPALKPRACKLSPSASQWLKMTNTAGAINILGSDFGQLIRPVVEECEYRRYAPCGNDLLVAPVEILKGIAGSRCGVHEDCLELAKRVF